ncbi:aldo/keto reductase [Lentzea sp. NEAU-D7]|uniref:aldo/keto reductase n=1 Tax=Lentzea sp. NEAU-D7 TaxID=2994667 RepID=UPI00224A6726|nr:aldo/keto reductase [Lentzea sp. NEAU-D7]MCX2950180.1 aldo/keto reductase [Lentzea sp. NEAU-D7]
MNGSLTRLGDRDVRRIGFGALRLLGPNGFGGPEVPENSESVLLAAARKADVIDTADCYGPHLSEEMIARTLWPYREGLVIATKGGLTCPSPGTWIPDAAPDRLKRCCEESLTRLRLDRIELYQLHAVDPAVQFEQSVEAMARLREEGSIRHVGLCNITMSQLERARRIVPIASVQNRYSVADRGDDALVDRCTSEGIAFLPWFPLQRGSLARAVAGPLALVARRHRTSTARVALAWLLSRSPAVVPIPGTGSLDHLDENLSAGDLTLTGADLDLLDGRELKE